MAYFIELGQDVDEGLYVEIAIINKNTGGLVSTAFVEHEFRIYGWAACDDYGFWGDRYQVVASNSNGMITTPDLGVVAIAIPPEALFGGVYDPACAAWAGCCRPDENRVLRFKLAATALVPPSDFDSEFVLNQFAAPLVIQPAAATKILATGTISFGDRAMACPRITLKTYPLYPNSATAVPPIASVQVSQVKRQLATIGAYDAVQAALTGGPIDPAVLSWTTGGTISQGGPLSNVIATTVFNSDPIATGLFLAAAAALNA